MHNSAGFMLNAGLHKNSDKLKVKKQRLYYTVGKKLGKLVSLKKIINYSD